MLRFKAIVFAGILLFAIAFIGVKAEAVEQCTLPPDGMVSWWGGDNNALDIEGNNDGSMMNGASYASGMVGEAFSFNGSTQYFEAPDSATLHVPTAVTLDAWVNTADPSASQMIVCKAQNIWNWSSYCLQIGSGGNLYFEIDKWSAGHYGVWRSNFTPTANTWYHVAATWQNVYGDVRDAKIYINGVEQAAQLAFNQGYDATFTLEYTSLPLFIGRDYVGNYYYNGLVDEVEIFDRVLSSSEIADIYNAGSAGKCKPFILTVNGSGNGSGTVSETGIDCTITNGASGGDCSEAYYDGTVVSLTPSADAGYTFTGWSGDCDADGQVTMDADKACTATFECSDPYEIINDLYDDVNTGVALRSIRTRLKGTLDSCFNRMPAAIDGDIRSLNYAVRYIEQFKMYVNKYIKTGEINGETGDGLLQTADELIASFTCDDNSER